MWKKINARLKEIDL